MSIKRGHGSKNHATLWTQQRSSFFMLQILVFVHLLFVRFEAILGSKTLLFWAFLAYKFTFLIRNVRFFMKQKSIFLSKTSITFRALMHKFVILRMNGGHVPPKGSAVKSFAAYLKIKKNSNYPRHTFRSLLRCIHGPGFLCVWQCVLAMMLFS